MFFILLLLSSYCQAQYSTPTPPCNCSQYLSWADCNANNCSWNKTCIPLTCSWYNTLPTCNGVSGCGWMYNLSCGVLNCSLMNTTSAGGTCANMNCGQTTIMNSDKTYNCTAPTTKITVCSGLSQALCTAQPLCTWNSTQCSDAACTSLNSTGFNKYCPNTYDTTVSPPMLQICQANGNTCQTPVYANFKKYNCNQQTMNTYTWSDSLKSCLICGSVFSKILYMIPITFIILI